ncbi:helix-turn-helix domain-containing protein [Actinoallomurus vinaceus]
MSEPPPDAAGTVAEFVAGLRRLKAWSGLSYRELEKRAALAGDALPHSTVASSLSRDRLPREEVVKAFTRACGCAPRTVDAWVARRRHLVLLDESGTVSPDARRASVRGSRITRRHLVTAGGVVAAAAVGAALTLTAMGRWRP